MVEAEKVSVRIVRDTDDVPYTEYAPPNTSTSGDPNERYIEVSTNERYRIEVKLLRGFKFLGHPKARVTYILDNNAYSSTLSQSKPPETSRTVLSHREHKLFAVIRVINGQKIKCGLTFGQIESDEDVTLGDKEVAQAVDEAGRIVVKIRRGRFGGKLKESSEPRAFDLLDDVDDLKSCKEVVYKHNVSHMTTHVPLGPVKEKPPRPGGYRREWIRAEGSEGKSIVFTIRYRSRAALIGLGIIDHDHVEPSQSETAEAVDANLNSAGQPAGSISPEPAANHLSSLLSSERSSVSSKSFTRRLASIYGATLVTDGEEGDFRGHSHNSNNAIMISDGEESDTDADDHAASEEFWEQHRGTLVQNEGEISTSRSNEVSMEPRQETPMQNGDESKSFRSKDRSADHCRQEAEAHAECHRRVMGSVAGEVESGQAMVSTTVKRKTTDEQMEDFPAAKR